MTDGFTRRTPSRRGEGAVLRQEILAAAARMLTESGREGDLSLRAVAREVGIAAPSVYLHFKDRAELVSAVTRRAYERLVAELRQARNDAGAEGPRAALRAMAQHYCRFAVDHPELYRLMFGIERMPASRDDLPHHPLWLVKEIWTEAVSACRDDPRDGGDDGDGHGKAKEAADATDGGAPTEVRPAPIDRPEDTERVVKLLWFSLHGVVAMAMAMPFAADRKGLEDMADDLLDLTLSRWLTE